MDTSDPWIKFDSNGICNHCSSFLNVRLPITAQHTHASRLECLWASIPRGAAKHDVVVGVSGGVDSSTVALMAQQAGLRVLAVHMDNGWDTPIALQNVFQLASLPGITYYSEVLDWNSFKCLQRAFIEAGVPDIEIPTDIAIQAVLHRAAVKYRIPVILSGGNISNEGILPLCWMYNPRDSRYAQAIITKVGLPITMYDPIKFGFRNELVYRLFHRIRTVYPLNEFKYNKDQARNHLADNIGWKSYGGKHCESTYTRFCQFIYQPIRHGIDYRRCHLSADICLGNLTRTQALAELARPAFADLNVDNDVSFVACKLDYTTSELYKKMEEPPLWYFNYPHRKKMLDLAYYVYRIMMGRKKASSF